MIYRYLSIAIFVLVIASCMGCGDHVRKSAHTEPVTRKENTFYCAPAGADEPDRGSRDRPWRSLAYAFSRIGTAGGAALILEDGTYRKPGSGKYAFERPVVVKARNALKARMKRLTLTAARNLVFEGITFDRESEPSPKNVVHLHHKTSYCTFLRCLMTHGTGGHQNTDALKINAGAHHILIEENVIFDGTDEEVDILGDVHDIVFRKNIIYQSKVIKPEALVSCKHNAYRILFEKNLFANLNAESSNGALRFGGSETKGKEAHTLIAIGNLFVNTTGRGAMTFAGATRCLVADNIFINHDDQRTGAVAVYTNYPKLNITNDKLYILHNVFTQFTKPWTKPVYAFMAATPKIWHISNNLYWNARGPLARDQWHDPLKEKDSIIVRPSFAGNIDRLTGTPDKGWFTVLSLAQDSPFYGKRIDLLQTDLPESLKNFLQDYRGQTVQDPWYRTLPR